MTHPQYPIPQDEEGRKRYESAKRHAALAKEQGKSLDEIHEIFKKVMNGTGKCSGRKEEAVSKCHGHYPIPEDEEGKSAMNLLCAMWPLPKKTASLLMNSMRFSRKSWKAQASAAVGKKKQFQNATAVTRFPKMKKAKAL